MSKENRDKVKAEFKKLCGVTGIPYNEKLIDKLLDKYFALDSSEVDGIEIRMANLFARLAEAHATKEPVPRARAINRVVEISDELLDYTDGVIASNFMDSATALKDPVDAMDRKTRELQTKVEDLIEKLTTDGSQNENDLATIQALLVKINGLVKGHAIFTETINDFNSEKQVLFGYWEYEEYFRKMSACVDDIEYLLMQIESPELKAEITAKMREVNAEISKVKGCLDTFWQSSARKVQAGIRIYSVYADLRDYLLANPLEDAALQKRLLDELASLSAKPVAPGEVKFKASKEFKGLRAEATKRDAEKAKLFADLKGEKQLDKLILAVLHLAVVDADDRAEWISDISVLFNIDKKELEAMRVVVLRLLGQIDVLETATKAPQPPQPQEVKTGINPVIFEPVKKGMPGTPFKFKKQEVKQPKGLVGDQGTKKTPLGDDGDKKRRM